MFPGGFVAGAAQQGVSVKFMGNLLLAFFIFVLPVLATASTTQDREVAKRFLYCAHLDAYFEQMATSEKVKQSARSSGTLNVMIASGLTDQSFSHDEMPGALDRFRADWTTAKNQKNLESFLRQKMDECLQLTKEHAERALKNISDKTSRKSR